MKGYQMIGRGMSMYCALPTRLEGIRERLRQAARDEGFAPIIPHDLGPFTDFEGNPDFGREKTLALMNRIMTCCDTVGIFGISKGVLGELDFALSLRRIGINKLIRTYPGFDAKWDEEYANFAGEYNHPLERLRGEKVLIILIGGRAVGKTHWSKIATQQFPIKRIKTTTTRFPRNEDDAESYNFVTREEFREMEVAGEFLETVEYCGNKYGSSLKDICKILEHNHGIIAMTPDGAKILNKYRYEINMAFILIRADATLMLENIKKRNIADHGEIAQIIRGNMGFNLHPEIRHDIFHLNSDANHNMELLEIFKRRLVAGSNQSAQ